MPGKLVDASTRELIAEPVRMARSHRERARGLLGSTRLDGALVIDRARQVHTLGMRYPIDVVFCDSEWNVVRVVGNLRAGRVTRWVRRARVVIELPAGAAAGIARGDVLEVDGL